MDELRRQEIIGALADRAAVEEGFEPRPYLCPTGHCSIGYGCNLEAHREFIPTSLRPVTAHLTGEPLRDALREAGMEWGETQARDVLRSQVEDAVGEILRRWPWSETLDNARFLVLADMAFNMGSGKLAGFRRMLAAAERGDYRAAADEMLDSLWASQVGARARELSARMRNGIWA
ncbi:glycoside hydrolase family 24 [Desulfovibrio sp. X2]|uniref:glycoside hydrolase family protein n=1 Tax=Desulfovibrio sp. X2 TaxID=941449 RepID=UPI000358D949|nr:glycoside hydrolase family 24 [Desulfovibrio sp. X2]EPR42708.1 glycoside hydrolase family 24 [Desulfovibrio sp. X2]